MSDEFPKLEEAKKILKRSFHVWSVLPEGDLFLRLIDPDGKLPELTFRGSTVNGAIEEAWEYAKNEEKAWKVGEERKETPEKMENETEIETRASEEETKEEKSQKESETSTQ